LDVDEKGLDEMDKRILITLLEKFHGGPVGISTLAVAIGEQGETIEEIYEPYLIQEGLIKRTPRGRVVTELAYRHFGMNKQSSTQKDLF
jgi:Holliday junction DNA helicase RuvB